MAEHDYGKFGAGVIGVTGTPAILTDLSVVCICRALTACVLWEITMQDLQPIVDWQDDVADMLVCGSLALVLHHLMYSLLFTCLKNTTQLWYHTACACCIPLAVVNIECCLCGLLAAEGCVSKAYARLCCWEHVALILYTICPAQGLHLELQLDTRLP